MKIGKMLKSGDVILAKVQFADTFETKSRPALILFKEYENIILAGVTSNKNMKGIALSRKDGAMKDSVIKLNYIFTISENMISKTLFHLSNEKKEEVYSQLAKKLKQLTTSANL